MKLKQDPNNNELRSLKRIDEAIAFVVIMSVLYYSQHVAILLIDFVI